MKKSNSTELSNNPVNTPKVTKTEKKVNKPKNLQVKVTKLFSDAVIPTYAHPTDAGMDMVAISKNVTDDFVEYGTGIAMEIPEGHVGLLFPRSSNSKKDLLLANSVGVVDSGYRGEIKFRFKELPNYDISCRRGLFGIKSLALTKSRLRKIYDIGDKIGQIIIIPYPKVDLVEVKSLSDSDRGSGGFGSTDRR